MLELRYVWDCESLEKNLEYREVQNGLPVTAWKPVPFVYAINEDDYTEPLDLTDNNIR